MYYLKYSKNKRNFQLNCRKWYNWINTQVAISKKEAYDVNEE